MTNPHTRRPLLTLGLPGTALVVAGLAASPPEQRTMPVEPLEGGTERSCWVTAVEPKPLSPNVLRGLNWLVERQHENGGWAQGEESSQMRGSTSASATPNVGDTCAATLALIRSGSTPSDGPYADAIYKAVGFIMKRVEDSKHETISLSNVRGTRLQAKLGQNIDTFLASLVLTEAAGHMPDETSEDRLAAALDKVLYKIQENQQGDGMWGGGGWAPALADAVAAKSLNRARQMGFGVQDTVLAKAEGNALVEVQGGRAAAPGKGSAGIALYSGAKNLGILQDSVNSNRSRRGEVEQVAASGPTPEARQLARRELARFDKAEEAYEAAQRAVIERLDDEQFVAGFGSNGGEEFLSHLNIGESMVVKGGDDWKKWDSKMTANLNRIQNADSTWTGHHCITGRTFCTATALMVLMVDRTPVPPEAVAAARGTDAPESAPGHNARP